MYKKRLSSSEGADIADLVGLIFTSVEQEDHRGDEAIIFHSEDGRCFVMKHEQSCCEGVSIEEIIGDLNDLENTPIIVARRDTNSAGQPSDRLDTDGTWTFFNFRTIKGSVTVRWFGSSNGYYSEDAKIYEYEA